MKLKSLYYITHVDNLPSIFQQGILSYERIETEKVGSISIFNPTNKNTNKRRKISPQNNRKNLLNYANLFFQPRNPMMYRAIFEKSANQLAVLEVAATVLNEPETIIADGNATDELTQFYPGIQGLKKLQQQEKIIRSEWWKKSDGSKRKIMAECLVPGYIKPGYIRSVIIADEASRSWVHGNVDNSEIRIICQPDMFFQPKLRTAIGKNISLIDGGDIFFSESQTLTVTVNLQRVMGKGLALRAKEQFPDVYVEYEKACRSKKITTERPYIYKREESIVDELADIKPRRVNIKNPMKWFLLFATKRDWRTNSRIEYINDGLKWLEKNCRQEGIESLAMSALGCSNGGLNWADVAPLMCKSLDRIGIPVEIYQPREYSIDPQYLTKLHHLAA